MILVIVVALRSKLLILITNTHEENISAKEPSSQLKRVTKKSDKTSLSEKSYLLIKQFKIIDNQEV